MQETNFDSTSQGEEMELQLWAYIDGILPPQEQNTIERLIAEQAAWKAKYAELLQVHQSLASMELEEPSLRFTKNVMEEIASLHIVPASKEYISKKIVWGLGGFFLTMIVGFVVYAFSQVNWSAGGDTNSDLLEKVTGADYSTVFNNSFVTVFMMLNIILGLMLFDRYLNYKKKQVMNNQ